MRLHIQYKCIQYMHHLLLLVMSDVFRLLLGHNFNVTCLLLF